MAPCISPLGLSLQNTTGCAAETTDTYFFHHSGDWKFKIKMLAGLVSPEAYRPLPFHWDLTWPFSVQASALLVSLFLQEHQSYRITAPPL